MRETEGSAMSDFYELGKRAVACKHWRWMPGMLLFPHVENCECCEDKSFPRRAARVPSVFTTDVDMPDLSDPATLGCLLALVRQAWGVERACVWWNSHDNAWVADVRPRNAVFVRNTEAEALVAALEAAP
jgi:hypothetical protein